MGNATLIDRVAANRANLNMGETPHTLYCNTCDAETLRAHGVKSRAERTHHIGPNTHTHTHTFVQTKTYMRSNT